MSEFFDAAGPSLGVESGSLRSPPHRHPFRRVAIHGWDTGEWYLAAAQNSERAKPLSEFVGVYVGMLEPRFLRDGQEVICASKDGIKAVALNAAKRKGATEVCATCPLAQFGGGCPPRVRLVFIDCVTPGWPLTMLEVSSMNRRGALDFFDLGESKTGQSIRVTLVGDHYVYAKSGKQYTVPKQVSDDRIESLLAYVHDS